tara:strand:- start:1616 stop:2032 length:417 start_codon:yes stop_codon:yes gene_type:complete
MASLASTPGSQWQFRRTKNTISFNESDYDENGLEETHSCIINISVKITNAGAFDLSYETTYKGNEKKAKKIHPLYYKAKNDKDDCYFEGSIVEANPITFHMIQCLLCDDTDKELYFTGHRPFNHYCGEVMRAITELEF